MVCKTVCRKSLNRLRTLKHKGSTAYGRKTPTLKAARSSRAERTKKSLETQRFQGFFFFLRLCNLCILTPFRAAHGMQNGMQKNKAPPKRGNHHFWSGGFSPPLLLNRSSIRSRIFGMGTPIAAAFSRMLIPSLAINQRQVAPVTASNSMPAPWATA